MAQSEAFKEIEHKFVVPQGFDRESFLADLQRLGANRINRIDVEDTYYVLQHNAVHVYRHRFDQELQQITAKSIELDSVVRTEINLQLQHSSNQHLAVKAFMNTLGTNWSQSIRKDVAVAYFDDCEIVHYIATCGDSSIECVEFEYIGKNELKEAIQSIERYESNLGFLGKERENRPLFELLVLKNAPQDIRTKFGK